MASQYAFQQATPPPNSRRGISPATSIFSRARTRSPPAPLATVSTRYNPALYNAALNAVGPHCLRRPSASPMRRGEDGSAGRQYNPQAYGQLAGNGGAFVPASQHHEERRCRTFISHVGIILYPQIMSFCISIYAHCLLLMPQSSPSVTPLSSPVAS
jgi:hypothetical protein